MYILGLETSCDETSASIVENGTFVLSNIISSQIDKHAPYGGVIPELAAREHIKNIKWTTEAALSESGISADKIDAVAVTNTPGLVPALAVGVSFAKGMSLSLACPLLGINHFLGHIYGAFLENKITPKDTLCYPIVALVVSGGHTSIVEIGIDGVVKTLGSTLDDAAGEAFDKAAKLLGLPYPGGPIIDKLAKEGKDTGYNFPRPMLSKRYAENDKNRFNFSFSGLKTSLYYKIKKKSIPEGNELNNICTAYQQAIVDVLTEKTLDAAKKYAAKTVLLCGGVACNSFLRNEMKRKIGNNFNLLIAHPKYCTDNAAMIAGLAYHFLQANESTPSHVVDISARLRPITTAPFVPKK
ncbi:MAG: tRNA (adenosine(37)-N6)-threonylcarbamoyltransferase complex transferase subunit TsaD [Verrucomicrobiota bacterium]|nr:tRNA (adenosine(37)-N6)-threonylcarbamoyltransferase complex transferase subunit TsaD [Verrucomicrobiota bacterium]